MILASFQLAGVDMQSFMIGTSRFNEPLIAFFMNLTQSADARCVKSFWYEMNGLSVFASAIDMFSEVDLNTEFAYDRLQIDSSIDKSFGKKKSFQILKTEMIVLTRPSGCGKTTL